MTEQTKEAYYQCQNIDCSSSLRRERGSNT
ncbi:ogr/Delta-like zinc finger family protein [Serratia marcescens]|nr:ogr/Delta-like zinc finger family protein [Serratia marcescens]